MRSVPHREHRPQLHQRRLSGPLEQVEEEVDEPPSKVVDTSDPLGSKSVPMWLVLKMADVSLQQLFRS